MMAIQRTLQYTNAQYYTSLNIQCWVMNICAKSTVQLLCDHVKRFQVLSINVQHVDKSSPLQALCEVGSLLLPYALSLSLIILCLSHPDLIGFR